MTDQRPWLKNYPTGVPANINADIYPSLVDMIEDCLEKYKANVGYYCMGSKLTFGEVDKLSTKFGAYLHSRGLEPGDKIALMMPNLLQYPVVLFGALKAGLIIVNTNPLYTPREMKHQFNDSGAKAIVIAENFAANLEKILADTPIKTIILTSIGEMLGSLKGGLTNFVVRKVKRMVPKYELPNAVKFKHAIKEGSRFKLPEISKNPEDVIILQYTGGTTGVSKGAMLTNKNLVSNLEQVKSCVQPFMTDGQEIALCALPLYHIFAFTVNCLGMLALGNANVLITNPRDINSLIKAFQDHPMSLVTGVNTLFNALLHNEDFVKLDFSNLKVTFGGGTAVKPAVAEEWKKVTGCALSEGYGLTESSPVVTINPLDGSGRLGFIGMPIPSTDVRIVNEQKEPLPIGQVGEIQVKGPQVMKGYYNRPEATSETISPDGWLSTGDIAVMDEDGYVKIVDRKKDMILVSGFNVFPNEIEAVLATHPGILEAAVIGVKSEKSGEVPKAFVVKKDNSLGEEDVIAYCREQLTAYKVPKQVAFVEELPKTNVGKVLRRKLKEAEEA
ncbi:MAG: AMP-binding protein [Bacteroidia bacterium]|nr:AMP-binding protein [Bacteroidia bacterium]